MQNKRIIIAIFLMAMMAGGANVCLGQEIEDGSRWWDGRRLYTATVSSDHSSVLMLGESEDMGPGKFHLSANKKGQYLFTDNAINSYMYVRGKIGWLVDYIQRDGLNVLVVRNPKGDAIHTLTLTGDDLKGCLEQQRIADRRDVSWMLQHMVLDTRYLGRFSKPQIRLLRNEILARHGWRFQSKDLQAYFGSKDWYKPGDDNKKITLNTIETLNLQLLKSEEALSDGNRVRYENVEQDPDMAEVVDGIITVTTEEQFINALGNERIVQLGADVHLNLSRILEQEDKFAGVPGRGWATVVKSGGEGPAIISEFCNDGQQLTLRNFRELLIRGERNSSIEVDPRYAYCLRFLDCEECMVENLTIGHTEGGYCDGGVISFEGGGNNTIRDCDLYGCGTYGIVGRESNSILVERTNVHDCTYGIMELYDCSQTRFVDCDFFNNREFTLIGISGSLYTSFYRCRFFANWSDAPLFGGDQQVQLMGCEIHHPGVKDSGMVLEPDNDCIWSDDATFIPAPRKQPIGPDPVLY